MQNIFTKTYVLSLVALLLLTPDVAAGSHFDGVSSKRTSSSSIVARQRRARRRGKGAKAPAKVNSAIQGARESVRAPDTMADGRLDGAFIQFWGNRVRQQWQQVLTAMQAAGMKTIILQYLKNRVIRRTPNGGIIYGDDRCPVMDEAEFTYTDTYTMQNGDVIIDPTGFILDFADEKGMEVYVGLINDEKFVEWGQWDNPRCLNLPRQIEDNKRFAEVLWKRYGKKPGTSGPRPSFKGWYLPQEMWNQAYTEDQLRDFRRFFGTVS